MKNKENLLSSSLKRGTNLQSVRSYNEKLVLQLIREHGELSKAEATIATVIATLSDLAFPLKGTFSLSFMRLRTSLGTPALSLPKRRKSFFLNLKW